MKQQIIQIRVVMEMNVNKIIFIALSLLILGCKSQIFEDHVNYDYYRIIEKVDYSDNSLNPKPFHMRISILKDYLIILQSINTT
jgi:hypothetical protein